jgi:hypothetical protein
LSLLGIYVQYDGSSGNSVAISESSPSASLFAMEVQDHRKLWASFTDVITFYEERNTEMGLTVMCSPAHKVFLNSLAHAILRILHDAHARCAFSFTKAL